MQQITRVGIGQTAKVAAALYVVMSAVILLPLGVFRLVVGPRPDEPPAWLFFIFPVIYGVVGFVAVAAMCWIYNLLAKKLGGIAVELSEEAPKQ